MLFPNREHLFSDESQSRKAMYEVEDTVDDLMRRVLRRLLDFGAKVQASRGVNFEILGVLLRLTNPRARLSLAEKKGTIFSCLGELLWYLSGQDSLEFIQYYLKKYDENSDDGQTIAGAYGPRLFNTNGIDQVAKVKEILKKKPTSRRCVIQLFQAEDLVDLSQSDVPCTCTLQFFCRDERLHLHVNMRSNDAYLGLPHDIFAFTMFQEVMARDLGVELGEYTHAVGSLHVYEGHMGLAERYLNEGWQSMSEMPQMPEGDPWKSIRKVIDAERCIRLGQQPDQELADYWSDLVRLLQIFGCTKGTIADPEGARERVQSLRGEMTTKTYDPYIQKRWERLTG